MHACFSFTLSTSFGKILSGREKSHVGIKVYSWDSDSCILCDVDKDSDEDVDIDIDDAELLMTMTTEVVIELEGGVVELDGGISNVDSRCRR